MYFALTRSGQGRRKLCWALTLAGYDNIVVQIIDHRCGVLTPDSTLSSLYWLCRLSLRVHRISFITSLNKVPVPKVKSTVRNWRVSPYVPYPNVFKFLPWSPLASNKKIQSVFRDVEHSTIKRLVLSFHRVKRKPDI